MSVFTHACTYLCMEASIHLRTMAVILATVNVKRVLDHKGGGELGGLRPHALAVVQHLPLALAHVESP